MFNLIWKDILSLKKTLWFVLLYGFIMVFAFQSWQGAALSGATIAVSYMLIMQACARDDKNKSEIMLNSLPLSRRDIVLAKYLSVFLYGILGVVSYLLAIVVITFAGMPVSVTPISVAGIVAAFLSLCIMSSLYYPLYFKLGYIKTNMYAMAIFFLFFFGSGFVAAALKGEGNTRIKEIGQQVGEWLSRQSDFHIVMGLVLIALVFMVCSYLISLKFYENREF